MTKTKEYFDQLPKSPDNAQEWYEWWSEQIARCARGEITYQELLKITGNDEKDGLDYLVELARDNTKTPLSDDDRNMLFFFDPYSDGVEIEHKNFKPEMLEILRDLVARGLINETPKKKGFSHIQLTKQGKMYTLPNVPF